MPLTPDNIGLLLRGLFGGSAQVVREKPAQRPSERSNLALLAQLLEAQRALQLRRLCW